MVEKAGRYEVIAPLRAGGMARIDLGRLSGSYGFTRYVVIKRPLAHHATTDAAVEQFRVEARVLGALHHPNVVAVDELGTTADGGAYLAMEYVHGASLRDVVEPRGASLRRRPSLDAVLSIVGDVAAALHHAHDRSGADGTPLGLVHRDVSPSNILLGYDGAVKLIDFGVAKLTDVDTLSGSLRGKISYMAPEQCKGQPIDRRADVFALGVVLYELSTGWRPYHADDDVVALHKVVQGELARPSDVAPGYPAELEAIVLRALAYDPADRYATAGEFGDALDAFAARNRIRIGGDRVADCVMQLVGMRPEPWRQPGFAARVPLRSDQHASRPASSSKPSRAVAPAPRRSRRRMVAIVAAAAATAAIVGVTIAVSSALRDSSVAAAPQLQPQPQPQPQPEPQPELPPQPPPETGTEPTEIVVDVGEPRPDRDKKKKRDKERDDKPETPVTEPPPPPPPAAVETPDARRSPDDPRWNPDIFLPDDPKKR
jgi:serine/threonine protein kinase